MSLISDTKFLLMISHKLEGFHQTSSTTWNCRCPLCGDSEKKKSKMRGYFYPSKNGDSISFKCHNCGESHSLSYIIKLAAKDYYQQYLYERLVGRQGQRRMRALDPVPQERKPNRAVAVDNFNKLIYRIDMLPKDHDAPQYLASRSIPETAWKTMMWTPTFMAFVNSVVPDKFNERSLSNDYPALILPMIDKDNVVFGFQGRSLVDDPYIPRYISIMLDENKERLFGLNRVDMNKKFYVVEGPLDSLFLDNSIAVCGSDMQRVEGTNAVFVTDCEPRNKQIVGKIQKLIEANRKVCLLPPEVFSGEDINDMIDAGYTQEEIHDLLDMHTYQGAVAFIQFQKWRRV